MIVVELLFSLMICGFVWTASNEITLRHVQRLTGKIRDLIVELNEISIRIAIEQEVQPSDLEESDRLVATAKSWNAACKQILEL